MKTPNALQSRCLAALALTTLLTLLTVTPAHAANASPPGKMTFQGFLTDASNPPVPLGNTTPANTTVIFKIYKSPTGATAADVLWAESQVVTVDKGHFSVLLGEGSAVTGFTDKHPTDLSGIFIGADASDRWIGLTVDGAEITPRIQFFAAPYAQLAKAATSLVNPSSGATLLNFANNKLEGTGDISTTGSVTSSGTVAGLIFNNRDATPASGAGSLWQWYSTGGTARLWSVGDKVAVTSDGKVGIGTSTPAATLHVNGSTRIDGANILELGGGVAGKEANAGKIGYQTFTAGALDILGAGTSTRSIKLWDNVTVGGTLSAGSTTVGTLSAGGTTVGTLSAGLTTVSKLTLSDGAAEKIILHGTQEAIGIQALAQYYRTAPNNTFFWYDGGSHVVTGGDPGTSGTKMMSLNKAGGLSVTGDVAATGNVTATGITASGNVTATGSVTSSGSVGGLIFNNREAVPGVGANGSLWQWYSSGGTARLWSLGDMMSVTSSGYVGIGIASPAAPLHVRKADSTVPTATRVAGSDTAYGVYLGADGAVLTAGGANAVAGDNNTIKAGALSAVFDGDIIASAHVWVGSALAYSDARAKNVVSTSDSVRDLSLLRDLKIRDFTWIDRTVDSHRPNKKLVAQEVEQVFPQAVERTPQATAIPNVYQVAERLEFIDGRKELRLTMGKPHDLRVGDSVDLYTDNMPLKNVKVTAVSGEREFAVSCDHAPKSVFVYGKYVTDFRGVDYDAIAMLNVSATQELDRQVQALKKSEARIAELEKTAARVAHLEEKAARVDTLEREMAELKKLVAGLAQGQPPARLTAQNVPTTAGQ